MSLLWVDTETGGLAPYKNPILSLAGFHEIPEASFSYESRPHPNDSIDSRALDVNGYTHAQISNFPDSYDVISTWEGYLKAFVNPYDPNDKLILAGYNTGFDARFLRAWFIKHGNNYFNSYFAKEVLDVLPIVKRWRKATGISLPNNKLVTVAMHFNLDGNFHTAMDDILATYAIYQRIKEFA